MKDIEFDVELTAKDLYRFSMRHTYSGVSGIFGVVISLACWIILAVRFGALDTLYGKSAAQAKQNKDINASLHYTLSEEQITVSQGEQEACVKWYDVRKCIYTAKALYLYMSPVRAFIFPADQCGDSFEQIRACVEERLGYYKDYDPSQEAETKQEDPK